MTSKIAAVKRFLQTEERVIKLVGTFTGQCEKCNWEEVTEIIPYTLRRTTYRSMTTRHRNQKACKHRLIMKFSRRS